MEKKRHTIKNNLITDFCNKVLYLSPTYDGKVHDKRICDLNPLAFPKAVFLWQDTGYQGHSPSNATILQPIKKTKGKPLTKEQKFFNKTISRARVYIEHTIAGVKKLRIVKEKWRNFREGYEHFIIEMACAIHNFRVSRRKKKKLPTFSASMKEFKNA